MTKRPQAEDMGWWPAGERSTIDRRRCASPTPASASYHTPTSSGPRCLMAQAIFWSLVCHTSSHTLTCKAPLMPHMSTLFRLTQELEHPGGRHLQTVGLLDFGPP